MKSDSNTRRAGESDHHRPKRLRTPPDLVSLLIAAVSILTMGVLVPAHVNAQEDTNPVGDLMSGLAASVAGAATSDLVGWGMASLGVNPQETNELARITSILSNILNELNGIDTELKQLNCNVEAQNIIGNIQTIQGWVSNYSLFIQGDPNLDDMHNLMEAVINSQSGAISQIAAIEVALLPEGGGGQGVIDACAALFTPVSAGTLGDNPTGGYYDNIRQLQDYYFGYQAQALSLYVEGEHYRAWEIYNQALQNGANVTPITDQTDSWMLCTSPYRELSITYVQDNVTITEDIGSHCDEAENAYATNDGSLPKALMRAAYEYGGVPFGVASRPTQALLVGSPYLWIPNLDAWSQDAGYSTSCTSSTSTAGACGIGVGQPAETSFHASGSTEDFVYGDNGGYVWKTADSTDWETLLENGPKNGTTTVRDYLVALGFDNDSLSQKAFFTGEFNDDSLKWSNNDGDYHFWSYSAACHIATPQIFELGRHTVCSDSDFKFLAELHKTHANSNTPCYEWDDEGIEYYWGDSPLFHAFYDTHYEIRDCHTHSQGWVLPPPGWLVEYQAMKDDGAYDTGKVTLDVPDQYHMPVVDVSALTCQPGRTPMNLGGTGPMRTMCSTDFDNWYATIYPPVPSTTSIKMTVPGAALEMQVPPGNTAAVPAYQVTNLVYLADLVSAVHSVEGPLDVSCIPPSGSEFSLGRTKVTCSAASSTGQKAKASFEVQLSFPFGGFAPPLATQPGGRPFVVRAGAGVPIEFSLGGNRGRDIVAGKITSAKADCSSGEITGKSIPIRVSSPLRYHAHSDTYRVKWLIPRQWGGECRVLQVPLVDSSTHTALVRFPHRRYSRERSRY